MTPGSSPQPYARINSPVIALADNTSCELIEVYVNDTNVYTKSLKEPENTLKTRVKTAGNKRSGGENYSY